MASPIILDGNLLKKKRDEKKSLLVRVASWSDTPFLP
jgi:hypothetical protein